MSEQSTELKLDIAFRLRRAVCQISEKRPSVERSRIDQFLRFISAAPIMVKAYGVDFPVTCRRHVTNGERTTAGDSRANVLYFHIGNAILGFYDMLNAMAQPDAGDVHVEAVRQLADRRVKMLEKIARTRLDTMPIFGQDASGYTLEDADVPCAEPVPV